MNILQKIMNLIKLSMKSETVDERTIKVNILGKDKNAIKYQPYGIQYHLPDTDILNIVLQQEGYEDSLIAIPFNIKDLEDNLEEKEIRIGEPTQESRIKFLSKVDDADADEVYIYSPEKLTIDINENLLLTIEEGETIFEDDNGNVITIDDSGIIIEDAYGNIITMDSSGMALEDSNGNEVAMGDSSVTINGASNFEVLQ